jgi:ABC-type sugar transport system ATPase subunit
LVSHKTVAENIWIGQEPLKFKILLDWEELFKKTDKLLRKYGFKLDPKAKIKDLSIANQQLVEITRTLSYNSEIIIMDEP